jgi:lambda repressor-like predicted transcriptional regulator
MKTLTPRTIKAHIVIATGGEVSDLAKKHQIHMTTMYRAINREIDSPRARKIICDATGLDDAQIWDGKAVK